MIQPAPSYPYFCCVGRCRPWPRSSFVRDDPFPFHGLHELQLAGPDINHVVVGVQESRILSWRDWVGAASR